ncbi:MAG: transposase [Actinobacteria bacterium]|nr:transposase [Actinomycetota bacterium]
MNQGPTGGRGGRGSRGKKGAGRPGIPLARVHDAGLFVATIPGRPAIFPYTLELARGEQVWEQGDPYRFLPTIGDLDLHLILDNAATHKTALIQRWVLKHPRVHLHFTPTSSSWLNLVECWFSRLQRRALARAEFASTDALEAARRGYIAATNAAPKPFTWTRTADEILASVARFCRRTSGSDH